MGRSSVEHFGLAIVQQYFAAIDAHFVSSVVAILSRHTLALRSPYDGSVPLQKMRKSKSLMNALESEL